MRLAPVAILLAIVATGCGSKSAEPAETKTAEHAAAEGAMCKEHGIAEAICTKCNPKLIPIFKAKGDWCEEHGFPESRPPDIDPDQFVRSISGMTSEATA